MRDFQHALRSLLRSPGFTFVVVLTLGLSIGAGVAIFSVVNAVILQPLPFDEPDELVRIHNHPFDNPNISFEATYPMFLGWREEARKLEDLAGFATSSGGMVVDIEETRQRVEGKYVSYNLFDLLGARPVYGRPLEATDDVLGAAPVVVISERLWRQRFSADPNVIGEVIKVDGVSRSIVSVMPDDFEYPLGSKIWVPIASGLPAGYLEGATAPRLFNVIGRVADGSNPQEAFQELLSIVDNITNPALPEGARATVSMEPLAVELLGDTRGPLLFLLGAALLVLLIACANVANLQTVRTISRQRELALRVALGARWKELARGSLAESLILALLGGALGLALAWWGIKELLRRLPTQLFRAEQIGLDGTVMLFALGLSLIAALIFGLLPAFYGATRKVSAVLQENTGRTTSSSSWRLAMSFFVVVQVALAVSLLIGAGLLLRSFLTLQNVGVGYDRELLSFSVPLLDPRYDIPTTYQFYDDLVARLEPLPGIEKAAGVLIRPLDGTVGYDYPITVEGQNPEEQALLPLFNFLAITPGYLETAGTRVLDGRAFTDADRDGAAPVVILTRSAAELLFPDGSAVGNRIKYGPPQSQQPWVEVVGIVEDGRYRGMEEPTVTIFAPYRQSPWGLNHMIVRTTGDPSAIVGTVRAQIQELDPSLQPMDIAVQRELIGKMIARPRFNTLLLSVFAALALVLGAVGLYGVMSYIVALRNKEVAIRLAMGAMPKGVLALALKQAVGLALVGVGVGLLIAYVLSVVLAPRLSDMLYNVPLVDLTTYLLVPLLLLTVAAIAGFVPARRASHVDPMVVLREE